MNISREEITAGKLTPHTLKNAVREFQDSGFVVLQQVVSPTQIEAVQVAYEADFEKYLQKPEVKQRIKEGNPYVGMHLPFEPPFSDPLICANPLAVQVMAGVMGDDFVCQFFHSNTTLPGSKDFQEIHIDMGDLVFPGFPVALPPWMIVVNFPLIDFTVENGATEVWPGTHLNTDPSDLIERIATMPSVRTAVSVGDLIIRDMRLWHRGAPNQLDRIRTMLAIVYNRPWFKNTAPFVPISRCVWEGLPDAVRHIYRDNPILD
ncbi:MAG: phytanoyl-CoA dioxygenase family protein [Chloroflexota bacterium]